MYLVYLFLSCARKPEQTAPTHIQPGNKWMMATFEISASAPTDRMCIMGYKVYVQCWCYD